MLLKEIKKLANEISLSCIASFVIGAYTVLLINFFWFDNHITPPGVSAFVASLALLFTVYAAFKVKEWSEQKMNEKAFTVADKIIEHLNQSYVDYMFASSNLGYLIDKHDIKQARDEKQFLLKYREHFEKSSDEHLKCLNLIDTLSFWNYETKHRDKFYQFRTDTNNYNQVALRAIKDYMEESSENINNFRSYKAELLETREQVLSTYHEISTITFKGLFTLKEKQ